ncbi:MAG: amino acid adenylation domain-containing protein [Ignavibacteriales bacterium]|nr:amino acid adenylation domain-containing protein [Ignavibacteriales bacterium]
MMNKIKELKLRALSGDLSALEELRQIGVLSDNKSKYNMAPVSYAQSRLWFIDKMDKSPAYNLPAALTFEGDLNVQALENAFKEIIKRHEILRTVFVETDGVPYQKIFNAIEFNLSRNDLSDVSEKEEKISLLIEEESNRCFDLSKGPLIVCSLIKLEEQKHLLIFNMHHIISDGWSIGILISELTQLYNSFTKGELNPLAPLKMQYKDYVNSHTQLLKEVNSSGHRKYWLDKFSGELPITELPADSQRPLYKTFNGKLHEINIEKQFHVRIENLCRQNNVSLFMFLVSIVSILINKYSGKTDVIIGSPVSGREQRNLEDQIGFYVNTIPLRNEVETSLSFINFLNKVKHNCIEAYDHQVYPFDLLIEDLNLERDTSRNPLFEIVVSLQEENSDSILFDGIKTSVMKPKITFSKFDLHFNFEKSSGNMKLGIVYNTDLYQPERIERLGRHFQELLQNILNTPDEVVRKIEIISPEEKEQIINVFNKTTCYYPKEKTIAELFEEIAEKYPDKPAIVFQGNPLTYRQLNERANSLAHHLISKYEIKLDEPVVLLMDRSHELIISILGVLKAGGAYLPIDTNMPVERINTILEDVKARIILTGSEQANNAYSVPYVIHITEKYFLGRESFGNINVGKTSSNLAYILYTSGSTGIPKGSMIEEKSVIRLVRNTNYYSYSDKDRTLSTSSISFDATTVDLWGMLLNGGTLYLENTEDFLDPEKLKKYFLNYKINKVFLPTGLFVRMVEADQQNNLKMFEGIKEVIVGGDKMPSHTSNKFIAHYPGILLLNGYGPTENTAFTTVFNVTKEFQSEIPIGKPIANTTVYIFSEDCNLCPIGVPGEIFIGGEGLSRGYVNRPELNKEKFVENPLKKGKILYRSGDIGEWCNDGNILFHGRNDDQLKIRGYRIETGEIENISAKYNRITNTKIIAIQEEEQKELALYYTSVNEISKEEFKKYLGKTLPEYMVPKYFIRLEEFPLNKNGKVDYKSFPKPDTKSDISEKILEPGNLLTGHAGKTEKTLAKIFQEILNVKNISITDNFFSLGGHSLKAIRAVSAIQKELSVKVSLKEFFTYPDILSLEEIIRDRKRETLGIIPVIKEAAYYDLSYAQKRLWVLDKIEKSKSTYNIPLAVTVYDEIDLSALQLSFDDMNQKHESIRTVFIDINGEPFQKIINNQKIPIAVKDFSNDNNPDDSAFNFVVTEAHNPFTLSEFPLVRLYVIKTSVEKYIILLNIHHIICDGWSLSIMTDELFGRYKNYIDKTGNPLVIPKIQYKDYTYWLNDRINKPENDSDHAYWLEKLNGEITPLDIPSDFRRPVIKTYQGNSIYYSFSKELKKNLDTFNIEKRSSLFMTLTAALKILLYKYTGKEDIIIGTPVAGRDHPDLENQIGYYVNTLALRDQIKPEKSFAELLEEIKTTTTESYSHQMYPFDKLVGELKLPRDTSRSPLFDVMIVLQNFDVSFIGVFKQIESYKIPMNMSKFDLTFNFNDAGEDLDLLIEYNTQLYKQERIEQIASHLFVLLNAIITNPAQSVKSINILSKEEENNLLRNYNDTAASYPDDKTIAQLFEESVSKYPLNTAVVYKEKTLTYSELNNRANKVARYINEKYSISAGEPVGVLIAPSENTIVILLAIIKVGGAYVPIDPEYPDERIKHILSESKTNIFITLNENDLRLNKLVNEVNLDCNILNLTEVLKTDGLDYANLCGININPDSTAYIIFTSGSTGKPKGCPISHRNLVRLFINDKSHFDFNSSDVWIMAHSYCFDLSVWEMYGALLFGGKIIIPDRNEVRDISAFVRLVDEHKVTILNQTPGAFYKFIDTAIENRNKKSLSLRYVIFGGEKLNPSKLQRWIKVYPAEKVKLINMYGITETTIHVTYHRLTDEEIISSDGTSNIGVPLPETKVYIFNDDKMLVPVGIYGEIYVAGTGLSKGYLNRPDLTAERFIQNPYDKNEILYKSGDVARWIYDGTMEYLDRSDNQVQIRGFRVEITEIEIQLRLYTGIVDTSVVAIDREGTKELAAYIVSEEELKINKLKSFLSSSLPDYMIPTYFIKIDKIPLTSNGKLDKKSLPPAIQNIATGALFENPANKLETELLVLWQEVLSTESISIHDNFFDLGGNSILLVKLYSKINEKYPDVMELTDLFSKSKISEQAEFISQKISDNPEVTIKTFEHPEAGLKYHDVAVIGIAARIGDCETPDDFWNDLRMGVDFIGEMPQARIHDIKELGKLYNIKTGTFKLREYSYLSEVDKFDYSFFKLSPSEAALIDPGQRMFMETAYHALEDAGYGGNKLWGSRTGVFIGASDNLGEYAKFIEASDNLDPNLLLAAQTPSILASRLSYHLNLKGPALLVDTACSSSLVAVHLACQAIREGKIDSAIVGGVKLHLLPLDSNSRLEIDSSDSRTHSFDESANGTGAGEGVIAIFIKPLENALKDKDNIYAVIKGSEINQDGNSIGITAPDADAQANAIEKAWLDAGIDPLTVSFIETHGTATKLGDPIEIDGITKAFRRYTSEKNICAIGAVKANIGHLDTAAGLAGLLKAVLSLKYKQLTPLVHFKTSNRNINFEESAAYINKDLNGWERNGNPLRCGVSSFGLSGTNCHVVLEEAPPKEKIIHQKKNFLFTLSSRSKVGLIEHAKKIKQSLYLHPDANSESICYTLATGRGHYSHRIAIVFENVKELMQKLSQLIENELSSVEADGIFYNYSKVVASNKKNLVAGEITENDIRDISNDINNILKNNTDEIDKVNPTAMAYVKGADILWDEYYNNSSPAKISLPGYPFEKKRCWVKVREKEIVKESVNTSYGKKFDNIFLSNCIFDTPAVAVYSNTFNDDNWLLDEHRVMGIPTLVGAAYLQMAYEAGKNHFKGEQFRFEEFYLLQPLKKNEGKDLEVLAAINKSEDNILKIDVHSKTDDNDWLTYAKFRVSELEKKSFDKIDIEEIKKRTINSREIFQKDEDEENDEIIQVSKKWNCLNKIYWNENEYLAELSVPEADTELTENYYLYPPLIDAALSYAIDEAGFLPYSFGTVDLRRRATKKIFSYIKKQTNDSSETRSFDITLADETGNIIAAFRNFTLKKITKQKQGNYFHELIWKSWELNKPAIIKNINTFVFYNSGCNQELVKDIKAVQWITANEIAKDNFTEIFRKFDNRIPEKIIFILPEMVGNKIVPDIDLEIKLTNSLYSTFNFAKYLSVNVSSKIDLLFVGKNVCEVTKSELYLNPLNNSVAGLGQVLQRESPNINCRFLDIDEHTTTAEIIDEINNGFTESYYYRAYRNGERFIREIKPVSLEERELNEISYKENGVYVITGGTGGIGLELAHFLAKQAKIKLALINRSEFLSRDKWNLVLHERRDEKLCRKIDKIREFENEGAEVFFYTTDVSDYDKLKTVIEKIKNDLGKICGVIHAAGVAGDGFIFGKDLGKFRDVIKPKIHGTIYLSELLKEEKPDFFIMTSALTAILPTAGQSDYTAANSFMDAYSSELNNSGINAVSINLTSWKETGMAYDYGVVDDGIFKSISTKNGVDAFEKIIQRKMNSVVLGEPDLSYLDSNEGLPFYLDKNMRLPKKQHVKSKSETEIKKDVSLKGNESGNYTEYEKSIAQIWGTVLGYEEINVTDNYYDLGGDSIHAIKINSLLEKQLKIPVTIGDLFNHLTIAELAEFLEIRTGLNDKENKEDSASPAILPAEKSNYYPVSSAQRRLFILDQLTKDKLSYHIPEIWNIKGRLNADELIKAFDRIIDRHEILRTSFDLVQDVPVQIVHENVEFTIPVSSMSEEEARNHIRGFIKPFNLGVAPLFRTEVIQLSPDNHLVLFDAHHIIIDAFSMEILKKEIFNYYEGIEPEPLNIQYKDYSIWQSGYYKSREAIEKKSYWIKQFDGEIPVINLPLDYSRTANQSAEAGIFTFCIDEKLTAEIKKMSAGMGISTFMILLAVYNIVLHKYTQQDDIIIGVTTMGRDNVELSNLLGMFVNNLPIRNFPKDDMSVIEFLNRVKETAINAFANQDYPFDELVEDLKIKRDLNRSPLFDVVFSYMNFALSEIKNGEMQISDYRAETIISSEYDMTLYGLEAENKIYITIKYKKSLFKNESIERFAGHFSKTVGTVTENKEIKLRDVDILLPNEIKLLKSYNNNYKKITKKILAVDLLKKSFTKNPEKIALLYKDKTMTYSELNIRANKLANYLRSELSVKPDDLIGIMVERTETMAVAMLGVLKSGAAYVGIDNAYPQKRIDYILNDCKAKILLTEKSIFEKDSFKASISHSEELATKNLPNGLDNQILRFAQNDKKLPFGTVIIDIDDPAIAHQKSNEPANINSLEDLSYIIYTSGSTGNPKGVAITHKNLSVFLQWCFAEFKSTDYDIVYASTSYCFDISVYEVFFSLIAGKTIRILKSALEIPEYLDKDYNVLVNTVPSLVSEIKDYLDQRGFNHLSALNIVGEQIPQTLIDGIDCDKIEVRNFYGPSEDTTYSTIYRFSNRNKKVLIGKPISNTQIYIVDRNLKLVPLGHTGEICITGDGLAKGYLFKDELTKEKFIGNPFGKGRLYKTGDLGRWTDTGDIDYLGRIDRQVKIRGFRIELGEIETNIRRYPSIDNAVVIAYGKGAFKDIAAYIVAREIIDINDLKNYLSKLMPAFMVPLYFVMMEKIPLTPNGKIDVKTLPEPELDIKHSESAEVEILNSSEELLAEIWKRVLEVDKLSIHDSFFDLGGHSLKALRLLTQINHEFKSNCSLSDIFEYPTIAQFANIIDRQNNVSVISLIPLKKANFYDVSHAQRRLWILDRIEKKSIAYNVPVVYQINSEIDFNALQNSFNALINKYESLRTYFIEVDGEPKQVISDKVDFTIDVIDVNGNRDFIESLSLPSPKERVFKSPSFGEGVRDRIKELIQKAITEPFNLAEAPLIKVTLLKNKSKEEYILIINIHHIVLDEWSINILADNLAAFYNHYSGKNKISDESVFAPSPVQYKEYADWHNRQIKDNGKSVNAHKNYWLEIFREPVQCLNLPSDYPRPKTQTFKGKTESFCLSKSLSEGLKKLSTGNYTTLFITTLALFNLLLSKYTKQNDIVIGTPIANREHQDIQDQIGFFLNTLALRNQSNNDESFKSFLNKVKNNTLSAFSHQTYPFDLLVDELQLPRDLSRSPLFDVMLISQTPAEVGIRSSSGLEMKSIEFDYPVSKFDLSISYYEDESCIKYFFEYNTALYKKERIENMFHHFSSLVESVLANDEKPISHLSIVSIKEKETLYNLSMGCNKVLANNSIVNLIEKRAAEFKDRSAVVFKRKKLTFEEVNSKANQFARFLIESKGVKPGEFICVMLDRSEWSIITMLAILKTGGVYIPVDPNYPQNRIDYILQDCEGKILITSEKYEKLTSFNKDRIITVEEFDEKISNLSGENLNVNFSPDLYSAAYVIYTSGSTGEPKGVLGTHKCLLNLIEWQSDQIESGLKTLQFAPHSFDVSIQEILFSLATAGTLYLIENETRYKMSLIAEIIDKEEIEMLTIPYSALNLFLNEVENNNQLKSLKHIITSGEQPFINSTIEKLLKAYPGIMFHNQYGPSETHVVTSFTLSGKVDELPSKIPIGRPINNTQIFLLDKEMEFVPVGIPGDLYIGGFNVAGGYINKSELTNEQFIKNPFGEGKLYKSGDVARWDNNGELEFLGRDDGQVKVRGYRIELGEIESCLLKYPDLKEAAVKLIDDGDNKEIAAYFTSLVDIDIISLKEFLSAHLPGYMIPEYFVKLEKLPHTPSGKIDIRSLPKPDNTDNPFLTAYIEPDGKTEIVIAEVWKEILHKEKISSQDNFFEIGGNSIKAIQVMSKVQKRLGKKTYLNLIFQQPTIKQMSIRILGTEEMLKNIEMDSILFNQESEKKIFFLPPGIGYSFAYMEFAKYFLDHSVYGINFIESAAPAKSTAEILTNLQNESEFYLFGHSAGGNMAYDVAIELKKQGRQVGGIILLDSYRQLELIDWSADEYLNDAILYIEQNHAEFLDEEIKDAAFKKIVAYRKYLNARTEDETLDCPIIQIEATDKINNFNHKISRRAWGELTPQFEVYEGYGGHMDMLKQPNVEKNALLTSKLLYSLINKYCDVNSNGNNTK